MGLSHQYMKNLFLRFSEDLCCGLDKSKIERECCGCMLQVNTANEDTFETSLLRYYLLFNQLERYAMGGCPLSEFQWIISV